MKSLIEGIENNCIGSCEKQFAECYKEQMKLDMIR